MSVVMDPDTRPRIYKSCLIRVGGFQDEHEEEDNMEEKTEEEGAPEQMDDIEEEAEEGEVDEYMHNVEANELVNSINPSFWELPIEEGAEPQPEPQEEQDPIKGKPKGTAKGKGRTREANGNSNTKAKSKKKEKESESEEKRVPVRVSQMINNKSKQDTGSSASIVKKKPATTYGKRKNNNFSFKAYVYKPPRYVQKQIDLAKEAGAQPVEEEEAEAEMEEEAEETVDSEFRTPEQQQQLPPLHNQPPAQMHPVSRQEQRIREELAEVQVARSSPNIDSPMDDRDVAHDVRTPKPGQFQHNVACILSSSAVVEPDEDNAGPEPSFSDEATKIEEPGNDPQHAEHADHGPPDLGKLNRTLVFNSFDTADDPIKSVLARIVHETEARVAAMERELDAEHEAVLRDVQLHYEKLKTDARIEIAREINKDFFSTGLRQQGTRHGHQRPPAAGGARMGDWPMRNEYYGIIPHYGRGREGA